MGSTAIIALIDKELARLGHVRRVLLKKEKAAKKSASRSAGGNRGMRQLSAEGREKIAAAQRKRWAAARRAKKA